MAMDEIQEEHTSAKITRTVSNSAHTSETKGTNLKGQCDHAKRSKERLGDLSISWRTWVISCLRPSASKDYERRTTT
jgi:hypothetical protein